MASNIFKEPEMRRELHAMLGSDNCWYGMVGGSRTLARITAWAEPPAGDTVVLRVLNS